MAEADGPDLRANFEDGRAAEYDPSILHAPVDVDPEGPVAKVQFLLGHTLRLTMKDSRVVVGTFVAYDKFGNFVLSNAEETFETRTRPTAMVVIGLEFIAGVEVGPVPAAAPST
jgi:small nuclear ribonucleoprotein (snRNP)-like protein